MPGKKRNVLPTQDELKRLLDYDPKTGRLLWRPRTPEMFRETAGRSQWHACNQWNARWAGKPALEKTWNGYHIGRFQYQYVAAHRLIWKLMTGETPDIIDHVNGDGTDNRFANLRNVNETGNKRNQRLRSSNKTGAFGIHYEARSRKWIARIQIGSFDTLEEAVSARKKAQGLLGFNPNHGRN